jgi:hypothetical protein
MIEDTLMIFLVGFPFVSFWKNQELKAVMALGFVYSHSSPPDVRGTV